MSVYWYWKAKVEELEDLVQELEGHIERQNRLLDRLIEARKRRWPEELHRRERHRAFQLLDRDAMLRKLLDEDKE